MSADAAILSFMRPLRGQSDILHRLYRVRAAVASPSTQRAARRPLVCRPRRMRVGLLEAITERQLPDLHEPGLRPDAAEARCVDGVVGGLVAELRRVGEVEDLEPDLSHISAGEARLLGEDEIDVLAELIPCAVDRSRRSAILSRTRVRECRGVEVPRIGMRG